MTEKNSNHYVDNKVLTEVLTTWSKAAKAAARKKLPQPRIPEYVAECMLKIANRLSAKPGFTNYTYKEDMVGDALESCLRYIHNFNPAKSKNAFAYITQIVHNAFIRRIQKEQKQTYVRMKIVQDTSVSDSFHTQNGDFGKYSNSYVSYLHENNKEEVITKFENWQDTRREKAKARAKTRQQSPLFTEAEEPAA